MKLLLFTMILALSFSKVVGKQKDSIFCPEIKLLGPRGNSIVDGNELSINVKPFKKDFMKTHAITYEWVAVNGVITNGKNKNTVYIDTKGLVGQQIKAAVLINGLNPSCQTSASMTIDVVPLTIVSTETRIVRKRGN
jgi:hypothetical protein